MDTENKPRTLSSVETTIKIIRELKKRGGATVTELAEELDMTCGGVYNHIATLKEERLIRKNGKNYDLSLHFFTFGHYVRNRCPIYESGRETADRLAEETGEYVHLMALEHGRGIHVYNSKGKNPVADEFMENNLETPDHLHYSAVGKAALAHLPEQEVDWIIEKWGLPQMTEKTIADKEELYEEAKLIRDQGYAINDEEELKGIYAIGAPIRDSGNNVIGAISISGPKSRLKGNKSRQDKVEQVTWAANVIELNLGEAERGREVKSKITEDNSNVQK